MLALLLALAPSAAALPATALPATALPVEALPVEVLPAAAPSAKALSPKALPAKAPSATAPVAVPPCAPAAQQEPGEASPPAPPAPPAPDGADLDPDTLEVAAMQLEALLGSELLEGPRALDWDLAAARLSPELLARFPRPGEGASSEACGAALERYLAPPAEELDRAGFVDALRAQLAGWTRVARARVEIIDLRPPDADGLLVARARLELAGPTEGGGRAQLQAELGLQLAGAPGTEGRLRRVELLRGHRATTAEPLLVEVSGAVGVGLDLSYPNRDLLQFLADERLLGLVGGLSVVDWDRDGFPDLVATRRRQLSTLFRNDGRGGFVRAPLPLAAPRECPHALLYVDLDGDGLEELVGSEVLGYEAGVAWLSLQTRRQGEWKRLERALSFELPRSLREVQIVSLVPADVDGDGLLDLYAVGHRDGRSIGAQATPFAAFDGMRDLLFINQGGLAFREEARERGLDGTQYGTAALFHDVDEDGDLDLVQANLAGPDAFFENLGAGRFERRPRHPLAQSPDSTLGLALGDLAGDGRLGLYRSGPSSPIAERIRALATRTDAGLGEVLAGIGAGGRLWLPHADPEAPDAELAPALGLDRAGSAFAPVLFELDGDGTPELFLPCGRSSHRDPARPDWETLHWRQVVADAVNVVRGAPRASVDPQLLMGFSGSFAGRQPDRLLVAAGPSGERVDLAYVLGLDVVEDGRTAAPIDFDGDGDLDLATHSAGALRLYENRAAPRAFARVALEATSGPAAAFGAVVTVSAGGREQVAVLRATAGLQTQVPAELHFGLGDAAAIELVRVRWPSGAEESWGGLPVGARLVLREGEGEARVEPLATWPAAQRPPDAAALRVERRATKLGGGAALLGTTGRPAVVCFHRPGGEAELATLRLVSAAARQSAGAVRFTTVCVDPEAAEAAKAERAREQLAGEPFVADDALLEAFFGEAAAATTPATFVFGADGRARRVLLRPLEPGDLETALAALEEEPAFALDLVRRARWQAGTGGFQEAIADLRRALRAEPRLADAHLEVGKLFAYVGDFAQAEEAFARAVTIDSELASGWYNLGTARMYLERFEAAAEAFDLALALRPGDLETQLALGTARAEAGQLERACTAYRLATDTHPDDPTAWYLRGKAAADLEALDEARAALSRALELDPELALAREALDALGG